MQIVQEFLKVVLCGFILLAIILALPMAEEITIYDRHLKVQERIQGGTIYDRNWNLKGYYENERIFDGYWNTKTYMKKGK